MNLLFAPHDCREGGAVPLPARIVGILIAFFLVTLIFAYAFHTLQYHWGWESVYAYRQKFINGWLMTLAISAAALFLSFAIGFCTALAQRSRLLPLRYLGRIYVETIRGTPLLVQILVFFYVVADAFGVSDRYLVGVITLSLFAGAYISEMIRAGIESVGDSQMESARAIGLTRAQIYRYVVFPQAFRQTIPPWRGSSPPSSRTRRSCQSSP